MTDRAWVTRRSDRLRVTLHARCSSADGDEQGVTLVNITPEGCCMTTGGVTLQPGAAVLVRLENGEALTGHVRWCDGERAGMEFDRYLPQHRVDHLRREQTTFLSDAERGQPAVRSVL
ncbi:MAG: PilZ domain-containing protein [Pseudomonadota bacterium]